MPPNTTSTTAFDVSSTYLWHRRNGFINWRGVVERVSGNAVVLVVGKSSRSGSTGGRLVGGLSHGPVSSGLGIDWHFGMEESGGKGEKVRNIAQNR